MARLVAALLGALACAGAAIAGTAEDPEVVDAAGDAGPNGIAAPAFGNWDLTAAWFAPDGTDHLPLFLTVSANAGAPPSGEVGVTFTVGNQSYISGYTVVPGLYSGGFLCTSDAAGDVVAAEGQSCDGIDATFAEGLVSVSIPLALINGTGAVLLAEPWGWSEGRADNGEDSRLDRTAVGRSLLVPLPEAAAATPQPTGPPTGRETPAVGPASLLALAGAAATLRKIRA